MSSYNTYESNIHNVVLRYWFDGLSLFMEWVLFRKSKTHIYLYFDLFHHIKNKKYIKTNGVFHVTDINLNKDVYKKRTSDYNYISTLFISLRYYSGIKPTQEKIIYRKEEYSNWSFKIYNASGIILDMKH